MDDLERLNFGGGMMNMSTDQNSIVKKSKVKSKKSKVKNPHMGRLGNTQGVEHVNQKPKIENQKFLLGYLGQLSRQYAQEQHQ